MHPHAEQNDTPPPPRSSHGCLWGCLGTLIAVAAVITAIYLYGASHFFGKMNSDSHIAMILTAVNQSPVAINVLGRNIAAHGAERKTYSYATGLGGTASYVLTVSGLKSDGEVTAELDISGSKPVIKSLSLAARDGRTYYLIGQAPPNPMMQDSI